MEKIKWMILALVLALSLVGSGLAAAPAASGKPQVTCPVMDANINKDLYADYQGQRVYFCCPACLELFQKDPEKYLKKMKDQGVTPEKSPGGQEKK
jgi:YHS domain-containing protein